MGKLLIFVGLIVSTNFAQAACVDQLPLVTQYGVTYLSIMERGGLSIFDDMKSGRSAEELCTAMTSSHVQQLDQQGDYAAVMSFSNNKECVVNMKLNDEGKFYTMSFQGCH